MSLKAFHIFFITVSALFFAGAGIWLLLAGPVAAEALNILAGLVCFSVTGCLVIYGSRFLQKFKHISSF